MELYVRVSAVDQLKKLAYELEDNNQHIESQFIRILAKTIDESETFDLEDMLTFILEYNWID